MRKLRFPDPVQSDETLQLLANEFKSSRKTISRLTGCIGALDGICIKIKQPESHHGPAGFYCRNGYYSVPVQALVDSRYRFLMVSAICKGSTHDSLAHSVSSFGIYLAAGLLNKDYWVAGDEAYSCDKSLLTPFPASMIRGHPFRDAYNVFQSSLRIHVEQAFGFLVSKWRILRELEYSLEVFIEIIMVTMMLHNYCIASNGRPHRINNYCSNSLELLQEEQRD